MSKMDVLKYLEEHYDELTESQKRLGSYILDNYREVAFLSALELGERLGYSDATVIRFAKMLGFEGYADFKNSIKDSIKENLSPDSKLLKSINIFKHKDEAISNIGETDLRNLESYLLNIQFDKIDKAVNEIYNAKTIYLLGLGTSVIIVEFLSYHLRRMGFKVVAVRDGGLVLFDNLTPFTKDDLLFVASFPRYSKDSMNAISFVKKRQGKVVLVTDEELSPLSMKSDIVLPVKTQNSSFFNSYIVPMELCNLLLISILEKDRENIYSRLKENIESMNEYDLFI